MAAARTRVIGERAVASSHDMLIWPAAKPVGEDGAVMGYDWGEDHFGPLENVPPRGGRNQHTAPRVK